MNQVTCCFCRGKSSRGLGDTYVKAISTAAVAKKEGAIQGGVRKWSVSHRQSNIKSLQWFQNLNPSLTSH